MVPGPTPRGAAPGLPATAAPEQRQPHLAVPQFPLLCNGRRGTRSLLGSREASGRWSWGCPGPGAKASVLAVRVVRAQRMRSAPSVSRKLVHKRL